MGFAQHAAFLTKGELASRMLLQHIQHGLRSLRSLALD